MESGAGEERGGGGAVCFKGLQGFVVGRAWCLTGEGHDRESMLNLGQVGQRKDIGGGGIWRHNIH